ncbi:MAG: ArsR/SmtB family transcription factor [Candidatus Rokuibacteriota bacterium]
MKQVTVVFDRLSTLADPIRSRLLLLLDCRELTVSELTAVLQLPQSTVSRHLRVLADDGWVVARADGPSHLYRPAGGQLEASARRLWHLVREQVGATKAAAADAQRLAGVLAQRRTRSQEFFSRAAGQWDGLRAELFGARPDLGAAFGFLDEEWTVGDLGCGTGQFTAAVAPFVRRVIAVDQSRAMLASARRRVHGLDNVELRSGDLEALPIEDGELDAAALVLVLHYAVDPARSLAEAQRALRSGGRLLVVDMVPHEHEDYRQQMGHLWQGFSAHQIGGWLEEVGFKRCRYRLLPTDPRARGPGLFAATARRG